MRVFVAFDDKRGSISQEVDPDGKHIGHKLLNAIYLNAFHDAPQKSFLLNENPSKLIS